MSDEEAAKMEHKPTGQGIMGLLLTKPQILRLPRISDHPHSSGFPPHHPPMTSFLGVPIMARGHLLGALYNHVVASAAVIFTLMGQDGYKHILLHKNFDQARQNYH